jgi:hypothetical protein
MKKTIISLIVALTGFIFIGLTLPDIIRSGKLKREGLKAEAVVVSSAQMGRKTELKKVTVTFTTAEGSEVTAKAPKRTYVVPGDRVEVWYNQRNPQRIDFGDTVSYNMRGTVIGVLILVLGLYFFFKYFMKEASARRLIRKGLKISAELVLVGRNEKYRMGDNNPWYIKCRWIDTRDNHEYFFFSKDFIIDPTQYMSGKTSIDVYIDPENPKLYFMDTSFMPKGNITFG